MNDEAERRLRGAALGKYRTILADPPWLYANFGLKDHGAARAHYAGMKVEDICNIPVSRWAEDDAVLVLWATWPKLDQAMRVIDAWGFGYVTGFPWVKVVPSSGEIKCGVGFWTQSTSELVIVSRRGSLPRLDEAPKMRGLVAGDDRTFYAPTGKHSAKPLDIQAWLEATVPGPRLELFARRPRAGWVTWGNELGQTLGPWGVRPNTTEDAEPLEARGVVAAQPDDELLETAAKDFAKDHDGGGT